MTQEVSLKVAKNSKQLAEKYVKENNFGRAFSHYLVALKLQQDWKPLLKEEFSTVLCRWGTLLEKQNRFKDLLDCYEQAIEVFPDNEIILNNLGAHLLRCGSLKESIHYFQKCLKLQPHFLRASRNLENARNLAVERWHFRMLNDSRRNHAFREALIKKIHQGYDRVLDVGTGTGILSLFAHEGEAKEIYACDSSHVMIDIANSVFKYNNVKGVTLLEKHSTELELPKKVSLLVTETLDSGLLGEGILQTLSDAWDRLLLPKPQSLVIPSTATLFATGIECDDIHRASYPSCSDEDVGRTCTNYDTWDLKRVPFKALTKTEKILTIDFNDPQMIKELLSGVHDRTIVLKSVTYGRLNCFAVWFDLCLDEDIRLTTNPLSDSANEAWDQALFFLPRTVPLTKDQEITVDVSFKNGKLDLKSRISQSKFQLSEETIKTLNDENLAKEFEKVQEKLSVFSSLRILDCFPFPVFGLKFLIDRSKRFGDKLVCFVREKGDKDYVDFLAGKHGVREDVTIWFWEQLEQVLEAEDEKFHVILLDLVDPRGEIREMIAGQIQVFRSLLNPGGILLPEDVAVFGQFIHSPWLLEKTSKVVDDEVTCGYNIKDFINVYQTTHHIDLDSNTLKKTNVSAPFELFNLESPETVCPKSIPRLPGSFGADANALLYWFRVKFFKDFEGISTNDATSRHRQAAFLLPRKSKNCPEFNFNVIQDGGLFNIQFVK